jgi:amino acid permease
LSERPRSSSLYTEPLDSTGDAEADAHTDALKQSGIFHATVNIAGEVMGAGVLSLPHAVVSLGWVIGISSVFFFAACAVYVGILLRRTRCEYYPDAESFADLAVATVGPRFGLFTRISILGSWALILPYFLIAFVSSARLAFPHV